MPKPDRRRRRERLFALLLGASVPFAASLAIASVIAGAYALVYFVSSAPSRMTLSRLECFSRWLQAGALAIVWALLFAAARWLACRSVGDLRWRASLALVGYWLGTAYFWRGFDLRTVLLMGAEVAVVWVGAVAGLRSLESARTQATDLESVRLADSLQALAQAAARYAGRSSAVTAVLWRLEGGALTPVADSEGRAAGLPSFSQSALLSAGILGRATWRWISPSRLPPASDYDGFRHGRSFWLHLRCDGTPQGMLVVSPERGARIRRRDRSAWQVLADQVSLVWSRHHQMEQARAAVLKSERERLSQEIHDTLAQDLVGATVLLEAALQHLERGDGDVTDTLQRATGMVRQALSQARELVWSCWDGRDRREDLARAAQTLAQQWSRKASIRVQCEHVGQETALPAEASELVLSTLREALNNVQKHARATEVRVTLTFFDDTFALDVCDDGRGFDDETARSRPRDGVPRAQLSGFGLRRLRECAERLGGQLAIESQPGKGATLSLQLPVNGKGRPQ